MEQQHELLTSKTSLSKDSRILRKLPSFEQLPEVNRTRKILLVLIGTLIVSIKLLSSCKFISPT